MVHVRWLAAVLFLALGLAASAGEIEVVDAPPLEEVATPDWGTSYEEARQAPEARPLFLYFTAEWCGYCHQMEKETFPDPDILRVLSRYACVKIDIDADANREVCRRYQPEGGIPAYVVVDPPGSGGLVLPGGFLSAATLLETMQNLRDLPQRDVSEAVGHHLALARFYLDRGAIDEFEAHVAALDLLLGDSEDETGDDGDALEGLLADAAVKLLRRAAWGSAIDVADAYLARYPDHAGAAKVRTTRAVARYHTDGVLEDGLKGRIRELLAGFEEPWPEDGALDRVRGLLGGRSSDAKQRARDAWVERRNAALEELARYGEAAVDLLLVAVRTAGEDTSERAATVLGWIGSPRSRPILARWAADEKQPLQVRVHAVNALGLMRDPFTLPLYRGQMLRDPVPDALVFAAAEAIRRTGMRMGAIPEAAVGNALLAAATNAEPRTRHECLHALLTVEAPYDLAPLVASSSRSPRGMDGLPKLAVRGVVPPASDGKDRAGRRRGGRGHARGRRAPGNVARGEPLEAHVGRVREALPLTGEFVPGTFPPISREFV